MSKGLPVTDPELLAELNNASTSQSSVKRGKPVTDPQMLAELNKPQRPSLEGAFPTIEPNWTQGAGLLGMAANPLMAAGRGVAPYAANALARISSGTAGGTAFDVGSKENQQSIPELVKHNALINTAIEGAFPLVKYGSKGINAISHAFRPQSHAENLINTLGSGQNLEDVGKSAAQDVNKAFTKSRENFNERYSRIFSDSPLANVHIYPSISPIQGTKRFGKLDELNLSKENFNDPDLRKMYQNFTNNPTLNSAHEFQKELGQEIGSLTRNKKTLDDAQRARLKLYTQARNAINADSMSFLKKRSPEMAEEFKQLSQDYKEKHLPFTKNTSLFNLSHGINDNPKLEQFLNVFRNPGKNINSILEQLPGNFKNKIINLGIGHGVNTVTPKAINEAIADFEKKGLESYLTPDIKNELTKMGRKQYLGHGLEALGGGIGGYTIGNMLGNPNAGAAVGALTTPFASSKMGPVHRGGRPSKNRLLDELLESSFVPALRAYEKYNSNKNE